MLLKIDDAELRAQLAQAEARFKLAGLNRKRSENLTEAQSMSQAEADRVVSEFSSAEAELSLLRVRLDKAEIKAPFDGTVGARAISPGDYITAATVITTLDDLSRMKIDFQVPERFVAKVRPGTVFTVRARSNSGESLSDGTVYFVSSVIDRATRSSQVKGYLNNSQAGLKPGMFASIELVLEVHRGVLIAPEGAVLTTPRGTQIVAVSRQGGDDLADFVPVILGLRARGYVEIEPVKAGTSQPEAGGSGQQHSAEAQPASNPPHAPFGAGISRVHRPRRRRTGFQTARVSRRSCALLREGVPTLRHLLWP